MLTLSQATAESRTILKIGAVVLSFIFLVLIFFRIGAILMDKLNPKAPAPPTVSFGKIPAIVFPNKTNQKNYTFSLDTVSGSLPVFPDRAKVFKIVAPLPDLLALQKAKNKVSSVGFTGNELAVSDRTYQWGDPTNLNRTLTMDILTNDFGLSSSFMTDAIVQSAINLPNEQGAITTAQNFLTSMSVFPNDIDLSKAKTLLFSISNSTLNSATSLSSAQVIEVDFFQKDVDGLSVFYPSAVGSTMNVLVVGGQQQPQIAQASFFHQTISNESATYPIKTAAEAFRLLQQGLGYVASDFGSSTDIAIKNVYLGYYIGNKQQDYLQPIVVFESDNGFFAYVPVIADGWVNK
jgi:hypothetical protein